MPPKRSVAVEAASAVYGGMEWSGSVTIETPFKDDRKAAYPNSEGADRPLISLVPEAVIAKARAYRLGSFREEMARADVVGLLLYDPVNIRYSFDSSNMHVWTAHNPTRYALILDSGPAIVFEYAGSEHLAQGLQGVDEVRPAITYMFLNKGDKSEGFVCRFNGSLWSDRFCRSGPSRSAGIKEW